MWLPLPDTTRQRLVERAERLYGRTGSFYVEGARFLGDCSGFVEAVYDAVGIPIREALTITEADQGSSVVAIRRISDSLGMLFGAETTPLPGDLVFWNDTYDRNDNGEIDDPLTHVGIVEGISRTGTVTFLHRGGHGVARGRMNLRSPSLARDGNGEVLNSRLRVARARDPAGMRYLSGELFAAFGRFDPPLLAAALEGSDRLDLNALGLGEGAPVEMAFPLTQEQLARAPVQDEQ
jgi:probable lipoprotein NlpC